MKKKQKPINHSILAIFWALYFIAVIIIGPIILVYYLFFEASEPFMNTGSWILCTLAILLYFVLRRFSEPYDPEEKTDPRTEKEIDKLITRVKRERLKFLNKGICPRCKKKTINRIIDFWFICSNCSASYKFLKNSFVFSYLKRKNKNKSI